MDEEEQMRERSSSSPPYSPKGDRSPRRSRSRSRSPLSSRSRSRSRSHSRSPGPSQQQHHHHHPQPHRPHHADRTALRISGLTRPIVEEHLDAIFSSYGKLAHVFLPRFARSGENRGVGYVDFGSARGAQLAEANMDGGQIDGAIVRVELVDVGEIRRAAAGSRAYEERERERGARRWSGHDAAARYDRPARREGYGQRPQAPPPRSRSPVSRKRRSSPSPPLSDRSRSPGPRRARSRSRDRDQDRIMSTSRSSRDRSRSSSRSGRRSRSPVR